MMDIDESVRSAASDLGVAIQARAQLRDVLTDLSPILIDGFADLLAQETPPADPLLRLAIYLMRHNPRHVRRYPDPNPIRTPSDVVDEYWRLYQQVLATTTTTNAS